MACELELDPNKIITARCTRCGEWLTTDAAVGGVVMVRQADGSYRPHWLCKDCHEEDHPALIWIDSRRRSR